MKKNIVTGQQIGLLGGPLYTTYKVLGAIALSQKLNGRAIYWLETNDADFNEINHIEYLDLENRLRQSKWNIDSMGYSCGSIEVDESLINIIDHFFKTIKQTEFTQGLREMALDCYQMGLTLGEASKCLAKEMFGGWGINIFDPQNKGFREDTKKLLINEANRTHNGKQCQMFCIINKRRVAVFKDNDGFCDRNGKKLDLEKYDLTPNVFTRNICQDFYFHTHTYIAGPAEIEYIKKLDDMYTFHNVTKPKIEKRMSLTLIEPKVNRIIKKLDLSVSALITSERNKFIKEYTKKITGFDAKERFKETRAITENYLSEIKNLGIDIGELQKKIRDSLKESIGKKRKIEKSRMADSMDKLNILFDHLLPFGKRQERIFNIFYYMNLYGGTDFIRWLFNKYDSSLTFLEI